MDSVYDRSIQLFICDGKIEFSILGTGNRFEINDTISFLIYVKECVEQSEYDKVLEIFNLRDENNPTGSISVCVATFLRFYRENVFKDYSKSKEVKDWDKKKSHEDFHNNLIKYSVDIPPTNTTRVKVAPSNEIELIVDSCFRPVSMTRFYDIYNIYLTPIPSNGARHPFYPIFWVKNKIYTYSIQTDDFIVTDSRSESSCDLFFLVCNFDVVQVRYPDSTAFNDILLEIGHMNTNLKLKAKLEGFYLKKKRTFSTKVALDIFEYEEVIDCFEIKKSKSINKLESLFNLELLG